MLEVWLEAKNELKLISRSMLGLYDFYRTMAFQLLFLLDVSLVKYVKI